MPDTFICAYALNGDGSATTLSDQALQAGASMNKPCWLHLSARSESARQWLHNNASLPDSSIVNALLAEDTRPRLMRRDEGMLLILRGVNLNEHADPEDMVSIRIWIDEQRFISVQLRTLGGVTEMQELLESGQGPLNVGDLITRFIEGSITRLSPIISDLSDSIDSLEDQIVDLDKSDLRDNIVSARRKTIIFNRFLTPQRDIVQKVSETGFGWLDEEHRQRLHEAQNEITRFVEDLRALQDRAQSIQDDISNLLTERLNRNTYALSVIAAIFLPLSFLTGLLGINVPGIPGADDPEAFLVFCGLLVAVVIAQIALFKKLRWF